MGSGYSALFGAIISLIVQQTFEILKDRRRLKAEDDRLARQQDIPLRETRLIAYAELWELLGAVGFHRLRDGIPPPDLDLEVVRSSLLDWYNANGLVMSRPSQKLWTRLVDLCGAVEPQIVPIRATASLLRTALAEDINSRAAILVYPIKSELDRFISEADLPDDASSST
jgi:hypothetical protein